MIRVRAVLAAILCVSVATSATGVKSLCTSYGTAFDRNGVMVKIEALKSSV